jgi:hypothetical protein
MQNLPGHSCLHKILLFVLYFLLFFQDQYNIIKVFFLLYLNLGFFLESNLFEERFHFNLNFVTSFLFLKFQNLPFHNHSIFIH